jgi:WD40 repeat protein
MPTTGENIQLPFTTSHAFIIGINDYQHLSSLNTAVRDAEVLAEALALDHAYQVHPPLLNACKADIEQLISEVMPEKIKPEDRVLFYFAGHGIAMDSDDNPKGYLVPADAQPGDDSTLVAMDYFHEAISSLSCQHGLLILDCCFAGAFKWSTGYRDIIFDLPDIIYEERFYQYVQDPAWQVITSSAADQKAVDILAERTLGYRSITNTEHSPFAEALLAGIAGEADIIPQGRGDGVITTSELYTYLRDRVEDETTEQGKRQSPSLFSLQKHDKGQYIFLHPKHPLNLPPIPDRNPFMGLKSYNEADSPLFYGRDRVINDLKKLAGEQQLIVVSGASGTGKSSVIKAGLLPQLRKKGWQIRPVIRPGKFPMRRWRRILSMDKPPLSSTSSTSTVLVIDQYEELITQCLNTEERIKFEQQIANQLRQDPALRVLISIRSEFEPQFEEGPLAYWWQAGRYQIPNFSQEELREIIVKPTIQEVLYFEPESLVDKLVDAVNQAPGALPLLSFTLSELYHAYINSGRTNRAFTIDDYQKLGGVIGALSTRANSIYRDLDVVSQRSMRQLMFRMISIEGGELASRRVLSKELIFSDEKETERMESIAQQLVAARLVSSGIDQQERTYYEPAHDALVHAWTQLWEWVKVKGEEKLRLLYKLSQAVNDYHELHLDSTKKAKKLLWNNHPRLDILREELHSKKHGFNAKEEAFVRKSIKIQISHQQIRYFTTLAVIMGLVGLTIYALQQQRKAKKEKRLAEAQLVISESNRLGAESQIALDGVYYAEALQKALAAFQFRKEEAGPIVKRALSKSFSKYLNAPLLYPQKQFIHQSNIEEVWIGPNEKTAVTYCADGMLSMWDIQNHEQLQQLQLDAPPEVICISPNEKRLFLVTHSLRVIAIDLIAGQANDLPIKWEKSTIPVFLDDNETIFLARNIFSGETTTIEWWNWQGNKINETSAENWFFKLDDKRLIRHDGKTTYIMDMYGQILDQFACPSILNIHFSKDQNTVFILQNETKEVKEAKRFWGSSEYHFGLLRKIDERRSVSLFPINEGDYLLSPLGNFLASGEMGSIRLFEADGSDYYLGSNRESHPNDDYIIHFAPDESLLTYFGNYGGAMSNWSGPYISELRQVSQHSDKNPLRSKKGEILINGEEMEGNGFFTNNLMHMSTHTRGDYQEYILNPTEGKKISIESIKAIHPSKGILLNESGELLNNKGEIIMRLNKQYQELNFFEKQYGFYVVPKDSSNILSIWQPLFEAAQDQHQLISSEGGHYDIHSRFITYSNKSNLDVYAFERLEPLHLKQVLKWYVAKHGHDLFVLFENDNLHKFTLDRENKWVSTNAHHLDIPRWPNSVLSKMIVRPEQHQLLLTIDGGNKAETKIFNLHNKRSTTIPNHRICYADQFRVYLSTPLADGYSNIDTVKMIYHWENGQQQQLTNYYFYPYSISADTLIELHIGEMMNNEEEALYSTDKVYMPLKEIDYGTFSTIQSEVISIGNALFLIEETTSSSSTNLSSRSCNLWDSKTDQFIFNNYRLPSAYYIPPSEKFLFIAYDRELQMWDIEQQQLVQTFSHQHPITAITTSSNGTTVLSGDKSGLVREWTSDGYLLSETLVPNDFEALILLPQKQSFISISDKGAYQWLLPKGLYYQYYQMIDPQQVSIYTYPEPSMALPEVRKKWLKKKAKDSSKEEMQQSELEYVIHPTEHDSTSTHDVNYEQIIRDFVQAEDDRDIFSLRSFFATDIKRYWNLSNPRISNIIDKYESSWKQSTYSANEITQIDPIGNNTFIILTKFTFQLQGQDQIKTKNSKVQLVFDEDGKIVEIYGAE